MRITKTNKCSHLTIRLAYSLILGIMTLLLMTTDAPNAQAQISLKERVQAAFGDSTVEVRFFRGRLNDVNDVVIALGANSDYYHGWMKFMRSDALFRLEGRVDSNHIQLIERDTFGNRTGEIIGTLDDFEGIRATWNNFNRTIGGKMRLIPYPSEPQYPMYCGDNKWIRRYEGTIGDEVVDVLLSRGTNFRLSGLAYFKKQNKSYAVDGELTNYNRSITLTLKDNNFKVLGSIAGDVEFKSDKIEAIFTDANGRELNTSIAKTATYMVGCKEFADFFTEAEITYPKTRNIKFNTLIEDHIQAWQKTARAYTRQYREQFPMPTPSMRASLRSYYWCDVDFYSDRLISSKATFTNTWENDYESHVFNFDFVANEEITLNALFKEGSDYQTFIQQYIQEEVKKRPFYTEAAFKQWMSKTKLPYFTIRKDGLNFISEFNAIYGEQHCTIPYNELKPYLKDETAIDFLMN